MNPINILYLDDQEMLLEFYAETIEEWGNIKVSTFSNPPDAFRAISSSNQIFDILMIDYRMPLMTGAKFISLLEESKLIKTDNIILFTSEINEKELMQQIIPSCVDKVTYIQKGDNEGLWQLKEYILMIQVNK